MPDRAGSNDENDVLRREKRALEAEIDRLRQALSASLRREQRQQDAATAERHLHAGALAASEGRVAAAEIDTQAARARAGAIGADLSRQIAEGQARLLASQATTAALEDANVELAKGRAAIALREADLRAVIESAIDCAIISTDGAGLVLAWNAGAERLLRWEMDRAVVMDLRGSFMPDRKSLVAFDADFAAALRGERVKREDWMLRQDGTRIWAQIEAMPLRTDRLEEPVGVLWMIRDRTDARTAESALRESEARLAAVLEQLPVAVGLADRDGQWVLSNSKLRVVMGDAIPSQDDICIVRWRAWDEQGRSLDPSLWPGSRALRGETVSPGIEFLHTRADGQEVWFRVSAAPFRDGSGKPSGLVSVIQDIDVERRTTIALRESEERFRLIVENARDYAILVTDERDCVTDWLPGAEAVFGWTADEILGQPAAVLFTPEDREAGIPLREFCEARAEGSAPDVRWHVHKDGSRVFVEGRVMALRHPDGRFRGVLKIGQDVTGRKRGEDRQALLSREVDHRARNMLALVQSMMRLTPAETVEEFVSVLGGRLKALSRVHSLLSDDVWAGVDLRTLVESELKPYLATGAGPHAALDGPKVLLPPDLAQSLAMVLHELATNAVKYGALSATKGEVVVTWTVQGQQPDEMTLSLRWTEAGGPLVDGPPQRQGFGSTVIDGAVQHQMGGALVQDWEPSGLVCTIRVPLPGQDSAKI